MEQQQNSEQQVQDIPSAGTENLLTSIPGRALGVILHPVEFYSSKMPRSGGYLEPLVFMAVMAAITGLVMAVVSMIGFGAVGMMAMGFVGVIMLPVMVAIFGFIGAAILFVVWKVMGSDENFETAYRCMAFGYAYAPVAALIGGIPYLGGIVPTIWMMALMAIASIQVHQRSNGLSWGVFGVLALVLSFMSLGAEHTGRQMVGGAEGWSQQMEQKYGNSEEMTPEDAGKMMSEILKNIQKSEQ